MTEKFSAKSAGPAPHQDTLQDLFTCTESVFQTLTRLLSRQQAEMLDRNVSLWKARRLTSDSQQSLESLLRASMGRDSDLADMISKRLHASTEDSRIEKRLLNKVALRTEELRWAIPRSEVPEVLTTLSPAHLVGCYQNRIVFVEKRRNLDWKAEGAKALEIFLRIDSLAAKLAKQPKPASFCTLDCLGYLSDRQDKEYAFVYDWPLRIERWEDRFKPKAMYDFLREGRDSIGPSLTIRFELARRLAACVQTFHLSGWLHKSINSHEVLCFPWFKETEQPHEILLPQCTYLTGFEYSRQDGRNYVTEPVTTIGSNDVYRHPEVTSFERRLSSASQGSIFQKSHDLFSLGLVLVEIGLWDTLEGIYSTLYRGRLAAQDGKNSSNLFQSLTPREIYDWMAASGDGSLEDMLLFSTGDRYTGSAMACIRGQVGNGTQYVNDMYSKVVEPLTYCTN